MLINTIEDFVRWIPTASGSEWSALQPHVETAQLDLTRDLLGDDLVAAIKLLPVTDASRIVANKLLAVSAYHAAIPFVDLVQTENGFAVVSNNNLAPASKERVERLIGWCEGQIDGLTDLLITLVMGNASLRAKWTLFEGFKDLVNCFFTTGKDFMNYINSPESLRRKEFMKHKAKLLSWQENIIAPVISKDYLTQLITEIRAQTFDPSSAIVINYCKLVLSALVAGDKNEAEGLLSKISNLLDAKLATYTAYAASEEYALKNATRDVNKADHPTFFFGL